MELFYIPIPIYFRLYEEYGLEPSITFANWLVVGIPLSILVFIATWVWLQIYALGKK